MRTMRVVALSALLVSLAAAGPVAEATAKKKRKRVVTKTFKSESPGTVPNAPVAGQTERSFSLFIPKRGKIKDVNVSVRLNNSAMGGLYLDLYAPGDPNAIRNYLNLFSGDFFFGRQTVYQGDNLGTGPNSCAGTGTRFDDEATRSYKGSAARAPWSGRWRPDLPLGQFDGRSLKGTWKLAIGDIDSASGFGTAVGCWKLQIKYKRKKKKRN